GQLPKSAGAQVGSRAGELAEAPGQQRVLPQARIPEPRLQGAVPVCGADEGERPAAPEEALELGRLLVGVLARHHDAEEQELLQLRRAPRRVRDVARV